MDFRFWWEMLEAVGGVWEGAGERDCDLARVSIRTAMQVLFIFHRTHWLFVRCFEKWVDDVIIRLTNHIFQYMICMSTIPVVVPGVNEQRLVLLYRFLDGLIFRIIAIDLG